MGLLRLYLALAVLISHTTHLYKLDIWVDGALAVKAFYLVSGFYIQLVMPNYQGQKRWIRKFYLSRAMRIFPLYYLIYILTALYNGSTCNSYCTSMVINQNIGSLIYYYASNLLIFGQAVSKFLTYHYSDGSFSYDPHITRPDYWLSGMYTIRQGWSLAIEMEFYLLAPWILRLPTRYQCLFAATVFLLEQLLGMEGFTEVDNWYNSFFPSTLYVFILGALAAKLSTHKNGRHELMCYAGLVALVVWKLIRVDAHAGVDAIFLFGLFLCMPLLFHVSRNNRFDHFIGDLSYPIYLNHLLVIALVSACSITASQIVLCSIIISILFAIAMVQLIDQPFKALRHRAFYARQNM